MSDTPIVGTASGKRILSDRFERAAIVTAAAVVLLFAVFYGATIANMKTVAAQVEDFRAHPYPTTVASGRIESLLYEARGLSERLLYVSNEEAISSVEERLEKIDEEIQEPLTVVAESSSVRKIHPDELAKTYASLSEAQHEQVALCRDHADQAEIRSFTDVSVMPLVDEMLHENAIVLEAASSNVNTLTQTARHAEGQNELFSKVMLIVVVVAMAFLALLVVRHNRQRTLFARSLERAVDRANAASQAKSDFLSSMSHDIRTPMNAIVGFSTIAERYVDDPARVEDCLSKIQMSSRHLLDIINNVLDMSRIESGRIEINEVRFSLSDLLDGVFSLVNSEANAKRLALSSSTSDVSHDIVEGDYLRLNQVLINLVGNAVKYTLAGGAVRVSVSELYPCAVCHEKSADDASQLRVIATADVASERSGESADGERPAVENAHEGALYRFSIEDTGIGMAEEFISRMFEPFEREESSTVSKIEGTGLGLPISKSLVELMGGAISVESECGVGTRFDVDVPLVWSPEPLESVSDGDMLQVVSYEGERVLLVEDDEINAEIARELIGTTGVAIEHAWNGEEAVNAVMTAPEGQYSLVFMDMQMPVMDGFEATKLIKRRCIEAGRTAPPIVAMTANAYADDRAKALKSGMDGYLVKPIDIAEVKAILDAFLGEEARLSSLEDDSAASDGAFR